MGAQISVYDQTTQPRMLLIEDLTPRLLQERYFPTNEPMDLFDSKSVLLDFDEGDFGLGAFVTKGYVDGNTTTYFANNVVPPRIGISDTIDCADKDRVLFEALCRNDLSPSHADALDALLRIKAARCVNRASRSIERLCVAAIGVTGASKESAVSAGFDNHHSAALIAGNICDILFKLNLDVFHFRLCFIECLFKIRIEFVKHLNVVNVTAANVVKVCFKLCGELCVYDFGELILEKTCDCNTELCGHKLLALSLDITSLDDC